MAENEDTTPFSSGSVALKFGTWVSGGADYWYYVVPFVLIACTIVMWPALSAPHDLFPPGDDMIGHLTRVEYLARRWRNLQFSDWFPEWYCGATLVQYYPPLSIWVGAAIHLITGSVMLTFKVFVWLCFVTGALGSAMLYRRFDSHVGGGIAAATLYSMSHFSLMSTFRTGTLGMLISLPLYPLLVLAMLALWQRPSKRSWVLSCLLLSLMVLAHAMHAYLLSLGVAILCIGFSLKRLSDCGGLLRCAEAALTGVALTAFWAIPGVTQWENPGVPWFPTGIHAINVTSWQNLVAGDSLWISPLAFLVTVIAVISGFFTVESRSAWVSCVVAWGVTTSLTFGPKNPLYSLLPFNTNLVPMRIHSTADLPGALLVGLLVRRIVCWVTHGNRKTHGIAGAILACTLSLALTLGAQPKPARNPISFSGMRQVLDLVPTQGETPFSTGRITLELPDHGSEQAFFPVRYGLNSTYGWNIEGSVHSRTILERNQSYGEGYYQHVIRQWAMLNVRSAIVDRGFEHLKQMSKHLVEAGWRDTQVKDVPLGHRRVDLLMLDMPSSYLMHMDSDVIAIGRSSYYLARLFPWVTAGGNPNPLSYDEEYLDAFKTIYLYDIPAVPVGEIEKRIGRWLSKGKAVIVDLSSSEQIPQLFGVWHLSTPVGKHVSLVPSDAGRKHYSNPIEIDLKGGIGALYLDLDETLLFRNDTEESTDASGVVGIKKTVYGDLYFTGLHIPRLHDPKSKNVAREIIEPVLNLGQPSKNLSPKAFETIRTRWDHKGVEFEYEITESRPVVVSVTYTPRWKGSIDGKPIAVHRHENLIALTLPAGRHKVTLKYGSTVVVYLGWSVTVLASAWVIRRNRTFGHT